MYQGGILRRNWYTNLKTFAQCYSQSPPPVVFTPLPPPHGFLRLEISRATAESRWGLGFVYIISLLKSALFFLLILFIYIKIHLFLIETIIRKASTGGKPNRKPYHPYGLINLYKEINQ
jgi:hypothetical protein